MKLKIIPQEIIDQYQLQDLQKRWLGLHEDCKRYAKVCGVLSPFFY